MGTSKAALDWHGRTLLHRTVSVLAAATRGPVVVVRAAGQPLPRLPEPAIVAEDPREGLGPLQGLAAGLAALAALSSGSGSGPGAAFAAATDMPFLHEAFIRRVLAVLAAERADVALPVARGYPQPLAAGYRVELAGAADRLVAAGRLRPADLFAACTVVRLDEHRLLADPELRAADPQLDSLVNVNRPAEYRAALARPAAQ
jgi:molybdopterin-guanine dinucleotide biosynthesis protein A